MKIKLLLQSILFFVSQSCLAGQGQPSMWQKGFQEPVTPVMHQISEIHNMVMMVISCIGILILGLVLYAVWRFRESKNPKPAKFSHNTTLEIIWTVIPILILIVISIPTFKLIYYMDRVPNADMTVKVVGHQWYWSYEYPDHGDFGFDSYIIPDEQLQPGQPRLLTVDNPIVVPVNKNIRIIATSADVIHSWSVPSFGVKKDTVPGRINETWFQAEKEGMFYGQCSELCGPQHGFMPIAVKVVSEEVFEKWVKDSQEKWG
jgi:cytochrome c oxidase subunit 2